MMKKFQLLILLFLLSCSNNEHSEEKNSIKTKSKNELKKDTVSDILKVDTIAIIQQRKSDSIKYAKIRLEEIKKHKAERLIKLVSNPNTQKDSNSITFSVSDVKRAKKRLKERSYKWAIQSRPVKRIEYCNREDYTIVPTYRHPFVKAVEYAYADHRPLTLSPDIVWLLICQGFSKHIELNNKKFKNKIVNFDNKKRIDIYRDDFKKGETDSLWSNIIKDFTIKVKNNIIDTSLHSTVIHHFSTTTEKEITAFEITFLEINRHYFDYTVWACGIPEITLEGKTSDWIWIRENVDKFRDYELSWWIDKLIPILDEFVKASQGEINLDFWSSIYRNDRYCNHDITGWFVKFFPYIRDLDKLVKNPLVLKEPRYKDFYFDNAIENESFTSGLSFANFLLIDGNKKEHKFSFVAGFVGIKQDRKTKALKPEINWLITD